MIDLGDAKKKTADTMLASPSGPGGQNLND